MQSRADNPRTRRPFAVVFVVVLLVSLCAAGIPASADSLPGGIPPGGGGPSIRPIPAEDTGSDAEAALLQTPEYPITCTGAKVIAEMTGGEGFIGETVDPYGDMDGDGHMDIGSNAYRMEAPNMYRVVDVFSGVGFDRISWGYAGRDPLYYSSENAPLGNIYGADDDPVGRRSEWAFWDVLSGSIWLYTDTDVAGEDWVLFKTLSVPQYIYGAGILTSLGDLLLDSHSNFAATVDKTIYVFGGVTPYVPVYTVLLDAKPESIANVGDVNSDGNPDFAVSQAAPSYDTGRITIHSGADGTELGRIQGVPGDRLGGWNALVNLGDTDGDGAIELLVADNKSNASTIRRYSLATVSEPPLIDAVPGTWPIRAAGDLNADGKQEYMTRVRIPNTNPIVWEWSVRSPEGVELARCTSLGDDRLGMASLAADSNGNNLPEFVIGVPTSRTVYAVELLPQPKKWTVMVYLDADNNLEEFATKDFKELAAEGTNADVNITVLFDRNLRTHEEYDDVGYDTWTDTKRFIVSKDMVPDFNAGESIGEADMGNPATLQSFIQWSREVAPAEYYFLVLWNHGSGLSVGSDEDPVDGEEGNSSLSLTEIEAVLRGASDSGNNPIDILGIDACLMGSMEMATQLIVMPGTLSSPSYARMLIASEDLNLKFSDFPQVSIKDGFDYTTLVQQLSLTPESLPLIAKRVVDDYVGQLLPSTLSAVDLGSPYDTLVTAVDEFAEVLIADHGEHSTIIRHSRDSGPIFGGAQSQWMIDLDYFAYTIAINTDESEEIHQKADAVVTAIGDTLGYNDAIVYERHDWPIFESIPNGISIYFPATEDAYNTDYDGDRGYVKLSEYTLWDEWLKAYYNLDKTPVQVRVIDANGNGRAGLFVLAMDYDMFTPYTGTTDSEGRAFLYLPDGDYRFRVTIDGNVIWSGPANHCSVPSCTEVTIQYGAVDLSVRDSSGTPEVAADVTAFKGGLAMGLPVRTDANGHAQLWLSAGTYTFQVTKAGEQYWTASASPCEVPACNSQAVTTIPHVAVNVRDADGQIQPGVRVWAMNGEVDTGVQAFTGANGQASLTLPQGGYYFRAEQNGEQFWSAASNHCDLPGCENYDFVLSPGAPVAVTASHDGVPDADVRVFAFSGDEYTGRWGDTDPAGVARILLPPGDYRFRVDARGMEIWSGPANHCTVPGCASVSVETRDQVLVTVRDELGRPKSGLPVTAFSGGLETGLSGTTDANGRVTLVPEPGSYRFRTELAGEFYWSGETDHCAVPGCIQAEITLPVQWSPVTITSHNGASPDVNATVYAFDGDTYTGYYGDTNDDGEAVIQLPFGDYRFRLDKGDQQYWSAESNHCTVPLCTAVDVATKDLVTVTVLHGDGTGWEGIPVNAFAGGNGIGVGGTTDSGGVIGLYLDAGSYRFQVDLPGRSFWTGETDHCSVPACGSVDFTAPYAVTIGVRDANDNPKPGVEVWAYDGNILTGFSATTDDQGNAWLYLPEGEYRFKTETDGFTYWSDTANHCTVPSCTGASIAAGSPVTITVTDVGGAAQANVRVWAMDGEVWTGFDGWTDDLGALTLYLSAGDYRFRVDRPNRQDWSAPVNHCSVPSCTSAAISVPQAVAVTVTDSGGTPRPDLTVSAFTDDIYMNAFGISDAAGMALVYLPAGEYRFRTVLNGTTYWSGEGNDCVVPGCAEVGWTLRAEGTVTVTAHNGAFPDALAVVYVFNGDEYTGLYGETNAAGAAEIVLPPGSYRFRVDKGEQQYWSGPANHCAVPQCTSVDVATKDPVTVTVLDAAGQGWAGRPVWAYNGTTYAGVGGTTDAEGKATLYLDAGSYRFRVDMPGKQFYSQPANHCDVPACSAVEVNVGSAVTVAVRDANDNPKPGLNVYAYNGTTYTNIFAGTNAQGEATLYLPLGNYRFRVNENGLAYYSGTANHCEVPGCASATIGTGIPVVLTVADVGGAPQTDTQVWAYNGTVSVGIGGRTDGEGRLTLYLPAGSYRFRIDRPGNQAYSAPENHCTVPVCASVEISVSKAVTVTVADPYGAPKNGLNVYAYSGTTYAGAFGGTNAQGVATVYLPLGSYRFRVTENGANYYSGAPNHCTVPDCSSASIGTGIPVVVTVRDITGAAVSGINVRAFNGTVAAGFVGTTDTEGRATLHLPAGSFRFRIELPGNNVFSGTEDHCTVPACTGVEVSVPMPISVSVRDANNAPKSGLYVYAYNSAGFANSYGQTDAQGNARVYLPAGTYRFRVLENGVAFWSGPAPHCEVPACTSASVGTGVPVAVTVTDAGGTAQAGATVRAYNDTVNTGFLGTTDAQGRVTLNLPAGSYRFRIDRTGNVSYSAATNHCTVPACTSADVTVPMAVTVSVRDANGNPKPGLNVLTYNSTTYAGIAGAANAQGDATLFLPAGTYRFRVTENGSNYWSGPAVHCAVPTCSVASVGTGIPVAITVTDIGGAAQSGATVWAYTDATYAGFTGTTDSQGRVTLHLPAGSFRFRINRTGNMVYSSATNHCAVPVCTAVDVVVPMAVSVSVRDANNAARSGLSVRAYNENAYAGVAAATNNEGVALLYMPAAGNFRFRVIDNSVTYWSGASNHCAVPDCSGAGITTGAPVTVTVHDPAGTPIAGQYVLLYDGETNLGRDTLTNAQGQVTYYLLAGNYRFRAYRNERFFFSAETNDCTLPGCASAEIIVDYDVTVTVLDANGIAEVNTNVQAYNGDVFAGYAAHTDAQGRARFSLPAGSYRFRMQKNGVYFYSGAEDHCVVPACVSADITSGVPVTVTVTGADGAPEPGLYVGAMDGENYTGINAATNDQGEAVLTLPPGNYRFRVWKTDQYYYSGSGNHCAVPECVSSVISTSAAVPTPSPTPSPTITPTLEATPTLGLFLQKSWKNALGGCGIFLV